MYVSKEYIAVRDKAYASLIESAMGLSEGINLQMDHSAIKNVLGLDTVVKLNKSEIFEAVGSFTNRKGFEEGADGSSPLTPLRKMYYKECTGSDEYDEITYVSTLSKIFDSYSIRFNVDMVMRHLYLEGMVTDYEWKYAEGEDEHPFLSRMVCKSFGLKLELSILDIFEIDHLTEIVHRFYQD